MSSESRNNLAIDNVCQQISALLNEAGRFRQHPTMPAWVPGLEAMLQQLKDLLDMEASVETENHLLQWIDVFAVYYQGIKNESPDLGRSLEALSAQIKGGIDAGWWRVRTELPPWAKGVDPAEGHSLDGFLQFLTLIEALEDAEIPCRDYEVRAALEQRRKTLRTRAQDWIREGIDLGGMDDRIAFDIPDEPTAKRWQALEDFAAELSIRADEGRPGDELETTIMLEHRALEDIRNLGSIPSGPGYHDMFAVIESLLRDHLDTIARLSWVSAQEVPEPSLVGGETAAQIANRELNLRFFFDLPLFIEYIEKLWSALESGESPAEGIYEASIICKDLFCRSGNRVLDVLDRKLTRMIQLVIDRGEVPEHELRLMELTETFDQGLAVYKHIDAGAFVAALYQIVGMEEPKGLHPPDSSEIPGEEPPASISSPQDAERFLSHAIHQTGMLLIQQPLEERLAELHRLLLKVDQAFHHGRVLSEDQPARIADRLNTAASDLPENLARLLVGLGHYMKGRKIASRSVFAKVLESTIGDARSKIKTFSYAEARPVWAAAEHQLLAVRRWTAGERVPSTLERELTHRVLLESAAVLEDNRTEKDFVRRLRELDTAVRQWEEVEADCELKSDIPQIESHEQFLAHVEEMEDICQELSARPAFTDPLPAQEPVIEIKHKLSGMKRLSQKGRKSTTQEREQVMQIDADAARVSADLCPTIPDFREAFIADIQRLKKRFQELMSTPEFADFEIRPLGWKGTDYHVLSPKNWILMGFVQSEGKESGLYRCGYEGVDAGQEKAESIDLELTRFKPNREKLSCLVPSEGKRITDLSWDPYGYMLAFRRPDEYSVGWVRAGNVAMPLEHGEIAGSSYVWTSKGDGLVVADPKAGKLNRVDITTGKSVTLTDLEDDGDPERPVRFAVPRQGGRLAFTSSSSKNTSVELRVLEFRGRRPDVRLLKHVPDAAAVILPFWLGSERLGAKIVSPKERSTYIIAVGIRGGEEEILYQSGELEPPRRPCPSPSLRYLAFFRTSGLALLDMDEERIESLLPAGRVDGELRFGKELFFVEGGSAAHCIELKNLRDERLPPPSL